jgi:hypothetical protein
MKIVSKAALIATAGAVLVTAAPVQARGGYNDRDRIDAGDVIAGALILGGIVAIASATSGHRDRDYDGDRNDGYYRGDRRGGGDYDNDNTNGYDSRRAVDACVRAAQSQASRYGWARVTDVTDISRVRGGYEIRGRLVVQDRGDRGGYYNRGGYNNGYDRGNQYDRYNDGYNKGKFTCVTRYNQIEDLRLKGLNRY